MTDTFTYDPLNRIATSEAYGITGTYTYNRRGDRTAFGPTPYVAEDEAAYTYDDRDRLTGVTTQGETVTYRYNGDNLLYERTAQGETTRYYYDGDQVIAEATVVDGVPQLKTRYIRGQGLVANEDAAGDKAYYLQNGHGDVIELRDRTGHTRLNQYAYDIWGNPTVEQENIHNLFRYSGEMWDTATKLQYLRARWYDPRDGRFLNEDTFEGQINNPLSLNLYTYVQNNPLAYHDSNGHFPVDLGGLFAIPGVGEVAAVAAAVAIVGYGAYQIYKDTHPVRESSAAPAEIPGIPVPSKPQLTVIPGGNNTSSNVSGSNNKQSVPIAPPVPSSKKNENNDDLILYHYTDEKGFLGILSTLEIWPSLKSVNPSDAAYGDGQYFTDMPPN